MFETARRITGRTTEPSFYGEWTGELELGDAGAWTPCPYRDVFAEWR